MSTEESSSFSVITGRGDGRERKTTHAPHRRDSSELGTAENPNCTAEMIRAWAGKRRLRRLRSDRVTGWPDEKVIEQWAAILHAHGPVDAELVEVVLDSARRAADQTGVWRSWSFLTLQVQLAAERIQICRPRPPEVGNDSQIATPEDVASEWVQAKAIIKDQVGDIPSSNWFERSRQTSRSETHITIAVPDEATREFLEGEYRDVIESILRKMGIGTARFVAERDVYKTLGRMAET